MSGEGPRPPGCRDRTLHKWWWRKRRKVKNVLLECWLRSLLCPFCFVVPHGARVFRLLYSAQNVQTTNPTMPQTGEGSLWGLCVCKWYTHHWVLLPGVPKLYLFTVLMKLFERRRSHPFLTSFVPSVPELRSDLLGLRERVPEPRVTGGPDRRPRDHLPRAH